MAQVQAFYDLEKLALFVRVIEEKNFYAHVCYYICVLILLYVSSYYCICVLILLYMWAHTTVYVSSYFYICPHTDIYVSSHCYICVLILLYMWAHTWICVLILIYMCPHTTIYVSSYYVSSFLDLTQIVPLLPALSTELHIRDYAYPVYSYICVSSYCYICVLILLYRCPAIYAAEYASTRTRYTSIYVSACYYICCYTATSYYIY